MSHPGSFIYPFKKTTTGTYAAAVFDHSGEHGFQPLPETINGIGGALLHLLQVQFHLYQFGTAYAPVIRTFQHFNFNDLHKLNSL
jgi:hypothetical protein